MLHHVLAVLALVAGTGDHARFHPANADVYVEMPDMGAAWKAYDAAPMVKLVRDPAVGKIADVATQMGLDVRAMIGGVMPVPDPKRPDQPYWPWSAATCVSMSLEGVDTAGVVATGSTTADAEAAAKAVARGMSDRTSGWIVADFADEDAAAQAILALSGTGGVTKVSVQGDAPLKWNGHELALTRLEASLFGNKVAMWVTHDGARLVCGIGRASTTELEARLANPPTSFQSRHAQEIRDDGFPSPTGTVIARAWSDLERLTPPPSSDTTSVVGTTLVDTFLPSLLPFVGQKGRYRMQLVGDRFVSESLTDRIGPAKELDSLYGTGGVPATTTRMVAAEAVGAWVMKIQPAGFEALMGRLMTQAQMPAAPDASPKMAQALGEGAAMFMMPLSIGNVSAEAPMPNVVMAVELKDGAAFEAGLTEWIERLRKADPNLRVENKPYHKLPMYTFSNTAASDENAESSGGLAASLRPTITILPDRVVITASRKFAQSEVRRIESKPTTVHALANEGALPKDAYEAGSMDWGGAMSKLYDAARGFLPMMAQGGDKPVDVNALPTSAELFRFFKPSASYSRRVDGRTYSYSESSFGPETPLGLALMGVAMSQGTGGRTARAEESRVRATVNDPAAPPPPTEAPAVAPERTATITALRTVKIGISLYKSQFDRTPATLEELLKGTDAFPNGFLDGNEVPKDGWGRALVYVKATEGTSYSLRSTGPNGVDDSGKGDDVSLP